MIIYEDIFTGKELFSDAYPCKLIDDFVWEAECANITIDNSIDDSAIGGNASAEDANDGGADDTKETAINLVHVFHLKKYDAMDKKGYTKYIKEYGKKLVEKMAEKGASEEEIAAFKTKMAKKCGEIVKNFKEYDCTSTRTTTKTECFLCSTTARMAKLLTSRISQPALRASNARPTIELSILFFQRVFPGAKRVIISMI